MVEAIVGLRPASSGRVSLNGRDITGWSPRRIHDTNVAYVPADRHRFGLITSFPITDNLVLNRYSKPPFARGMIRNDEAILVEARENISQYDIRTPSPTATAGTLSGGNQQKVVVAREFDRDLVLLVLDQPTRGLDVGSIEFIHRQIIAKRNAGTAVLLVSAELDEVLEMSDRIAVMYRGQLVATLDGRTADKNEVGVLMATGGRELAEVGDPPESGEPPESGDALKSGPPPREAIQ
jgi:simple sugar transport system ATP-binding protein